jgi:hypothetical protein
MDATHSEALELQQLELQQLSETLEPQPLSETLEPQALSEELESRPLSETLELQQSFCKGAMHIPLIVFKTAFNVIFNAPSGNLQFYYLSDLVVSYFKMKGSSYLSKSGSFFTIDTILGNCILSYMIRIYRYPAPKTSETPNATETSGTSETLETPKKYAIEYELAYCNTKDLSNNTFNELKEFIGLNTDTNEDYRYTLDEEFGRIHMHSQQQFAPIKDYTKLTSSELLSTIKNLYDSNPVSVYLNTVSVDSNPSSSNSLNEAIAKINSKPNDNLNTYKHHIAALQAIYGMPITIEDIEVITFLIDRLTITKNNRFTIYYMLQILVKITDANSSAFVQFLQENELMELFIDKLEALKSTISVLESQYKYCDGLIDTTVTNTLYNHHKQMINTLQRPLL